MSTPKQIAANRQNAYTTPRVPKLDRLRLKICICFIFFLPAEKLGSFGFFDIWLR